MNLSDILTYSQSPKVPYYNSFYTTFTLHFSKFVMLPGTSSSLGKIQNNIQSAKKTKNLIDRFLYDEKCSLSSNQGLFNAVRALQRNLQHSLTLLQNTNCAEKYISICEECYSSLQIVINCMFHGFYDYSQKSQVGSSQILSSTVIQFDNYELYINNILDSLNISDYQLEKSESTVHEIMKYMSDYVQNTDKLVTELIIDNQKMRLSTKKLIDQVEIKYANKITLLEEEIDRLKNLYSK